MRLGEETGKNSRQTIAAQLFISGSFPGSIESLFTSATRIEIGFFHSILEEMRVGEQVERKFFKVQLFCFFHKSLPVAFLNN